jgi:hypothetical protein
MALTKQDLIKFGMIETTGDEKIIFPMKKVISIAEDNEDGELAICVTMENNVPELVLATPEGKLYLNIATLEELQAFERFIDGWEPNY